MPLEGEEESLESVLFKSNSVRDDGEEVFEDLDASAPDHDDLGA